MPSDAATEIEHPPGAVRVQFRQDRCHCRVRFEPIGAPFAGGPTQRLSQASTAVYDTARSIAISSAPIASDDAVLLQLGNGCRVKAGSTLVGTPSNLTGQVGITILRSPCVICCRMPRS